MESPIDQPIAPQGVALTHPETPPAPDVYRVAVRELCEFAAKRGDLDLRFTPSPTSQQGIEGHNLVTRRRGVGYQREVRLQGQYKQLTVVGRADGFDAPSARLEEIKTHKGRVDQIPENHRALHWAQAKVYGALQCEALALESLSVVVVYFDITTQSETPHAQTFSRTELNTFFHGLCEAFLMWAAQELVHRTSRNRALGTMQFPHPAFRTGQRALAENVFRAARLGRCLMAQAPTGIGKTVGTLFPLLKACPEQELDKVFFLTAKTNGRGLALQALAQVRHAAPQLPLRVVEIVARDKACVHPDKACHGESCPLAQGFYDRLPEARADAVQRLGAGEGGRTDTPPSSAAVVALVAATHAVCPYYLGQELVRWADVVVGDYNYFFDSSALLHAMTDANQWRVAVLVDEAHNLVDRAREMHSVSLDWHALQALRKRAPKPVKRALDRIDRAWRGVVRDVTVPYTAMDLPAKLVDAVGKLVIELTEDMAHNQDPADTALLDFFFACARFDALTKTFGPHAMFDVVMHDTASSERQPGLASTLSIRNVVPAPYLKPRFAAARTTVLFSATLSPVHYYMNMLGLPDDTAYLDVDSPFHAEQLQVKIASNVSTRFKHRSASVKPIARAIATQMQVQPGNYLAFFSSYEYMTQAADALAQSAPDITIWHQRRNMTEAQRQGFLDQFVDGGRGVGFAVLGGAFAEGIDLPGQRLIGAFIATLGLPQINPVNEAMRERMQGIFGAGYDYTYFYPGMRKVVQAAGRVIRTPDDRGAVFLLDDRFATDEAMQLLPTWWSPVVGRIH